MTLTSASALLFLAAVALIAVPFRLIRLARKQRVAHWAAFANRHGLNFQNKGEAHEAMMAGIYRGVPVQVSIGAGRVGLPLRLCTVIHAGGPWGAPSGLEVLPKKVLSRNAGAATEFALGVEVVDKFLRFRAVDTERAQQILSDPAVTSALLLAGQRADFVRVSGDGVELQYIGVAGLEIDSLVELAAVLYGSVAEGGERPWTATASRFNLFFLGTKPGGERVLQGAVEGQKVLIIEGPREKEGGPPTSRVQVSFGHRGASMLRIVQRLEMLATEGATPSDNAIADSLGVEGKDEEFVTNVVGQPDIVPRLVSLFRKWPGGRIEGGRLAIERPGLFGNDLAENLAEVLEFTRLFRDAVSAAYDLKLEADREAEAKARKAAAEFD